MTNKLQIFLYILFHAASSYSQERGAPVKITPSFFVNLTANSRYQFNSKNYFKNLNRDESRSRKFGGGIDFGYQFLDNSLRRVELMLEGGIKRLTFNQENQAGEDNDQVYSLGLRATSIVLIFPISYKFGYSHHNFKNDFFNDTQGIYYGLGFDIRMAKHMSIFMDLTNYVLKENINKHLSGYDFGLRIYF